MRKLAVITTHPIQYYAPVFKLLNQRKKIDIKVFYTLGEGAVKKLDHGFNKIVEWDIPLLEGYEFEWMKNTAVAPGSHYFKGIVNSDGIERIKKYQPDAILIFGWAYNAHLKIIRYFSGKVPIYFRGDSTLLNELGGLKKALRYVFLKWVYKHINYAFYVGKNNRNYYKAYGLKESQLSFAPHAIDSNRFETDRSKEASELRSSFGMGNNDILILYAGKFEPVKNIELLLSAFITLNRANVHLLLAGNGPNENDLKEQADKSGAANVHFTGFKNQTYMPVLYQAADLFCLPSNSETWGLSINEAMACGKAVLVSDKVGCAADLIEDERNGAVFISDNIGSLVERLQQLTKDKAQLAKLGEQSKQIIKNWSFLHIAEAIENKLLNEAY
jgi:glycosyltransferase involved in cell wall biosynthesis